MELNLIAAGIELVGTTIKNLTVENTIVDVEKKFWAQYKRALF